MGCMILDFVEGDAEALAEVHYDARYVAYSHLSENINGGMSKQDFARRWLKRSQDGEYRILVCKDQSTLLGFVAVILHGSSAYEVTHLYVAPHAWRKGVGRLLLDATERFAQAEQCEVFLWAAIGCEAEKFYQRLGFVRGTEVRDCAGVEAIRYSKLISVNASRQGLEEPAVTL